MKRTRRFHSILPVPVMITALVAASAHAAFDNELCRECSKNTIRKETQLS